MAFGLSLVLCHVSLYFILFIVSFQVRMMAELFNCIMLIKMYAWEKSFARTIAGLWAYINNLKIFENAKTTWKNHMNVSNLKKIYIWEHNAFYIVMNLLLLLIPGIRSQERKVLEKSAYTNSVSTSVAPMVPIMASVFVITAHVMTGNPLSATQVRPRAKTLSLLTYSRVIQQININLNNCM